MQNWYGVQRDDGLGFVEANAVLAGERAKMLLELQNNKEATRRSIRSRLASTLVQIGIKLDPLAAEDLEDEVA